MGVKVIHRKELFNQLKPFMYEKDPEADEGEKRSSLFSLYEKEVQIMKEEKMKELAAKEITKPANLTKETPLTNANIKSQKQIKESGDDLLFVTSNKMKEENSSKKNIISAKQKGALDESLNLKR